MIGNLFKKFQGSFIVASNLPGQRKIPYLPRPKLEALRDQRIRGIVAHAAKHVPYYRELFAKLGIQPRQIQTAADLDRLPLLDRELVRKQPQLFISQTPEARNFVSFLTSGSTGTPIEIHHDPHSLLCNIPYGEREREPVNKLCASFRPRELYVGYETSTFKKVIALYERTMLFPMRPRRRFVSLLEPIDSVAAIANAERPDVLVGYGGWIDLFFKTIAAKGIKVHIPKVVMYMGEALPHGSREFIEQKFGVAVMSRYNAVESFKIGFFCESRGGFHVHEDLCHIRIAGPDGNPVQTGEHGQIVISNLINRGSVLLNYPIGDMGAISGQACSCGRTFKLLSELEGRVEDLLPLSDGRVVHPRSVWEIFKHDPNVLQYQLTQHEANRFELKLVTLDEAFYGRALEAAMPNLRNLLGADAQIETHWCAQTIRLAGGKFRAVACRCGTR
jgi:phenylacetate-CoA ligase